MAFSTINAKRLFLFAALLALTLFLAVACTPESAPQTTISPKSDVAGWIQGLYQLVFWAAVVVFIVVEGLLIYAVIRFRQKRDAAMPSQVHGHRALEIGWTIVPAVILIVIAVPTWLTIFRTAEVPANALQVDVIGHQWWWEFRYPGLNVVTANELHIPVDEPVVLNVSSQDVLHSFWPPQLAGKTDLFPRGQAILLAPGSRNRMWFTPQEPGTYLGQCAEFCGISHANMRFRVMVHNRGEFDEWVRAQRTPPGPPTGDAALGAQVYRTSACIACHTIEGASAGVIGPNLTHVGSRTTIAAGLMDNTPDNLARWLRNPPEVKPGAKMPNLNLTVDQVSALVAYLESLK